MVWRAVTHSHSDRFHAGVTSKCVGLVIFHSGMQNDSNGWLLQYDSKNHVRAQLSTPRLLLRSWRHDDLTAFAELNADPRVMEFFPGLLTRAESDARVEKIREHFDRHGFGWWAVEAVSEADFVGVVGLSFTRLEGSFTSWLGLDGGWIFEC